MVINVIRWKLNELMARKRIRNKDLAEALGITENSVYRLRRIDEMPRLSPERLNGICTALACQPGELLEWLPDNDTEQGIPPRDNLASDIGKKNTTSSSQLPGTHSFLTVVPESLESA
jgi:putative transcriptional regulator